MQKKKEEWNKMNFCFGGSEKRIRKVEKRIEEVQRNDPPRPAPRAAFHSHLCKDVGMIEVSESAQREPISQAPHMFKSQTLNVP